MTLTLQSTIRLSSGRTIPVLGLGVYRNDKCKPACLAALAHGYRHIDSARMYKNEKQVGEAVRESGVPREDIFITSKIYQMDGGYEGALAQVNDSLKVFGFDYIDLYLIHSPLPGREKRLETWRALLDAKKAGKLRSIGVSNYGPKHIEEIRAAGFELPSVNQVELHPLCQQKDIVECCNKYSILVEAYAPLIRGDFSDIALQAISKKVNKALADTISLCPASQKPGPDSRSLVTPARVRRYLSYPAASVVCCLTAMTGTVILSSHSFVPLPKSEKPERVRSNADLFDFELSKEDMDRLDGLDRGKDGSVTWNPVDAD
ncbi:hypothetical protein EW146_g1460 [Bondarzewia mesenterica]|uniref:NADP-dependent oxidoreductase domain-containing protein n=1 Tax=Bondarzewia mesenterica TaxID=1095465 RepID=A0A4S4M3U1_9AGAM|nr:hypothetical protein EW146_g1460 [Bondarzewia mesenterica]